MYSISQSQVYGDKTFDSSSYLPSCMYSMKPYYLKDNQTNTDKTIDSTKASMSLLSSANSAGDGGQSRALKPLTGLNHEDQNVRLALEDMLSRQMILLCRLNDIEQQLLVETSSSLPNITETTKLDKASFINLKISSKIVEDLVVQFDQSRGPPLVLLTVLKVLSIENPIIVNYHLHSSCMNKTTFALEQQHLKDKLIASFKSTDQSWINSVLKNVERSKALLKVTLIGMNRNSLNAGCQAIFASDRESIIGELSIVHRLVSLISLPKTTKNNTTISEEQIWSILTNPNLLNSNEFCLQNLGQHCMPLSESKFFLEQPSVIDLVVWSVTNQSAATLKSLLNPRWSQRIESWIQSI